MFFWPEELGRIEPWDMAWGKSLEKESWEKVFLILCTNLHMFRTHPTFGMLMEIIDNKIWTITQVSGLSGTFHGARLKAA